MNVKKQNNYQAPAAEVEYIESQIILSGSTLTGNTEDTDDVSGSWQ